LIKEKNLKICLYTGLEDVSSDIKQLLDYLKTGPYIPEKGGLASKSTNQKFIDLKNGEVLNNYFNPQSIYCFKKAL
jgi:anaerobic ribonucleoside-triphosphate reductase activating protein